MHCVSEQEHRYILDTVDEAYRDMCPFNFMQHSFFFFFLHLLYSKSIIHYFCLYIITLSQSNVYEQKLTGWLSWLTDNRHGFLISWRMSTVFLSFTELSLRKKSQDQMPWRISGGQKQGCVIPEWSSKFSLLEHGPYQ